jgi:hypothetical protein
MHFDLLVVLNGPVSDLRATIKAVMLPFYVENDAAIRRRWDWFTIGDGPFTDETTSAQFAGIDEPMKSCISRVDRLPGDYSAAALLTPDGIWHDIEDFGWRLIDENSPNNERAAAEWRTHFTEIIGRHRDAIGVEVHCHG